MHSTFGASSQVTIMSVQGLNGEQCLLPSGPGFLSKIGTVLSLINKAGYFIGHLKVLN